MNQQTLLQRCRVLAGVATADRWQPDDAIGFLQSLRPGGEQLPAIFEGVPHGPELLDRLRRVFLISGDPRRPTGGQDAYFIVRHPATISPDEVRRSGEQWLANLIDIDRRLGNGQVVRWTDGGLVVRVLEGRPPKHPRDRSEQCELLLAVRELPKTAIESLEPRDDAALGLARAYYFIACDAYLRDYLLWPVYRELVRMHDPLEPYFVLWQHGIKFRIFNNESIDFYIPRAH